MFVIQGAKQVFVLAKQGLAEEQKSAELHTMRSTHSQGATRRNLRYPKFSLKTRRYYGFIVTPKQPLPSTEHVSLD